MYRSDRFDHDVSVVLLYTYLIANKCTSRIDISIVSSGSIFRSTSKEGDRDCPPLLVCHNPNCDGLRMFNMLSIKYDQDLQYEAQFPQHKYSTTSSDSVGSLAYSALKFE